MNDVARHLQPLFLLYFSSAFPTTDIEYYSRFHPRCSRFQFCMVLSFRLVSGYQGGTGVQGCIKGSTTDGSLCTRTHSIRDLCICHTIQGYTTRRTSPFMATMAPCISRINYTGGYHILSWNTSSGFMMNGSLSGSCVHYCGLYDLFLGYTQLWETDSGLLG